MNSLLSISQLSAFKIKNLCNLASCIEKETIKPYCGGKIIATLFFEPSTRTKLSFQTATIKIRGTVIDLDNNSSLKKGESEEDTVRTVSQYADLLVIRHPKRGGVDHLASYSSVPVINAGDGGNEHPTQALLDYYTIKKRKPTGKITIMFTGDLLQSRTLNSLVKLLDMAKDDYELIYSNGANEQLQLYKHTQIDENQISDIIHKVDVLYMTRFQIERYTAVNNPYRSNFVMSKELANKMKGDAIIMHPLPRLTELPPEIDSDPRAVYFEQVKNGLYVRMAILLGCLEK